MGIREEIPMGFVRVFAGVAKTQEKTTGMRQENPRTFSAAEVISLSFGRGYL